MRVFVLGATGRVGRQVTRRLAGLEGVSDLVVAAGDIARAQSLAEEVGATPAAVAGEDEDLLTTLLAGCDAIVNVSGPDERVLIPALTAAIRSGTSYCDISADGATIERALDLHGRAESAGVTAVVGIGSAPGFTNLLCRHAVSSFDEVDEVRFGYLWEVPQPAEARRAVGEMRRTLHVDASWQTLFQFVSRPVRVVSAGELVTVDPWANPQTIVLPGGGAFAGYPVGSSEPVTLCRHVAGLGDLVSVVGMFPPTANDLGKSSPGESRRAL